MSHHRPAPRAARRTRPAVLALLAVVAVLGLAACLRSSPAPPATSSTGPSTSSTGPDASPVTRPGREGDGQDGEADGHVPDGTTVFADELPAVANLDPALLAALQAAATDAERDGVTFFVNSGWRSPGYQEQLLREAVAQYGSAAEAARWVATADTSSHVSGDAVDLAQTGASQWLAEHGAAYGLCQVYRNEPWHYELRADAAGRGCPEPYVDPSQDPRLQQ
ncbi:D-alanyl-D-alanine carboxypeptidase family protein [Krasilnikoviella flava]|uniref:D-alanyl-D-alanine carboxypeptidase n=1 Tax=Krasilnikoviella flava TaxID=526729 RepID=A0A1T5IJP8_9MICO|nr:D-alanyl-D-alanine carboxypeptidase family protein [Krasilnikoviella flava]SKC39367.1 D-alanyl-D-alanine carboxypeptidase [Krasilnikoviella flava]